jgi:hypothetical protein
MDILKMLEALRNERARLEEAIMALERLAGRHGKRRGRPPAWMSAVRTSGSQRGRQPGSKSKVKIENAA